MMFLGVIGVIGAYPIFWNERRVYSPRSLSDASFQKRELSLAKPVGGNDKVGCANWLPIRPLSYCFSSCTLFLNPWPTLISSRSQSLLKKKENIGSLSLFFMIPWRKDGFINLNNETMLSIYCFIYCFTDILLQLPSFWSRIVWWASYPWGILSCHLCSMQYFTPGVLLGIPRKGVSPVLLIPNLFQTKKMSSFTLVFRPGL